ncbi:hypothetical protein [Streptomyces cacaoi]|uniref:Uncharacterized protein n=1 Tax=Streptomyces cacaoi TaxID=1898 RepID=A0A4Y3R707_STRCI|nr:hypothetical protein [Streptomyces cacaoi]NNG87960.1 hypothetical protein [Streptomyces cacaoi]GEB51670.1 hypothetical protein SCA03_42210 [Streptomyces cacaoi]
MQRRSRQSRQRPRPERRRRKQQPGWRREEHRPYRGRRDRPRQGRRERLVRNVTLVVAAVALALLVVFLVTTLAAGPDAPDHR